MTDDALSEDLPPGSYKFFFGNGGGMFVRIEGSTLIFLDNPPDPIVATLFVEDRTLTANLEDEGSIEEGHLVIGEARYKLLKAGLGLVLPKREPFV